MSAGARPEIAPVARVVARHSLAWLLAANLVGLWLSVCLLWPAAGDRLAPLTYGRWMPLHLDWQLYGWCALPLVGALLAWMWDERHPRALGHARGALGAWSLALALAGLGWLSGTQSGKLFQDWHGWTRPLLPIAMHGLWALLAAHTFWRWRRLANMGRVARVGALAGLLVVPSVLYWSGGRNVYPAVNPDSGGATGAALLGSTLGIVTLYLALPRLLGLAPRGRPGPVLLALAASWAVFAVINHGDVSHHGAAPIAALGLLLAWIPLLPYGWAQYEWPEVARPWRQAAVVWWALLVLSGWITFLPGVSEALKFTHGLVAHAHLAMAGFVTSVNGALLAGLTGRATPRGVLGLWQLGCAVLVVAMLVLGSLEAERAGELFRSEGWTQGLLATRLAGGLAMTFASARWLADTFRR